MADITLKNSKTRQMERLDPIVPGTVSMYLCGPTVYDRAHIGNARSAVAFDQLFRLLRHVYGPENVTFVRNFTDVDDKINARAAETGRPIGDITAETAQWYLDDMGALGVLEPNHMPRATEYIAEMVTFIEDLIAKDHAYARDGHVLFRVRSFAEYGKLSGRSVDDMIAGARVEVAPYKEDPMDFVLWKPSTDDIPGWDSPWGRGRPGWHIECSAMSHAILGEEFDIHAGGADLLFPHHENEVAQSCAAGHGFARIWLHNEMLQVEGKKMSKSLGNFFTVRDLLDQGVPGEVIRMVFLGTHYGKPMDWTEKKREEAEKTLRKWYASAEPGGQVPSPVVEALADDLNTHAALTEMYKLEGAELGAALSMMGLWKGVAPDWAATSDVDLSLYEDRLREARTVAMESKDFSEVDALKKALLDAGVEVRMSKAGVELLPGPDFDAAKLEGM
ncbi:cysteine--tRNA ligase [Gymnodinialimonas hymeniacidonis]|uniref:cysteine--tRNA ligase n=1 Tax=Gymnodinialimonas hymeniacidonis TaxID=3126508 RepID=UPI0034C5D560